MSDCTKSETSKSRKRMSISESTEKLKLRIHDTTNKLMELWDEVHMEKSSREARIECAYSHFYTLLDDIVKSEKDMVHGVRSDIETRMQAVADLREIFRMPSFNASTFPENSIALLKALDKDLTALKQRKEKIVESQLEIYKEHETLCKRTDTPVESIDGIGENIIQDEILEEIRVKNVQQRNILNERLEQINVLQTECKKIQDILSHHCNITREEVLLINRDFTAPSVTVSADLFDKFSVLEQKLKDQYDEWIEEVAFRYDELLIKMTELSKKCFNAYNQENLPLGFDPTRQGECDVQKLEEKLKALEEKYQRGKPVFDKLNEWLGFWREKLDAERKVCRTSFYRNRGGALSASLKRQKQVCQQVPKVFAELKEIVTVYVEKYGVEDILIEGMLPDKYAEYIMEEYQHDKEVQKAQKQFTKKPSGKENIAAGKSMMRSIFKVSHELASPAPSNATTTLSSRKRSFSCSQISLISPTKPPLPNGAPITSSPKIRRYSPSSLQNHAEPKTPRSVTPSRIGFSGSKPNSSKKLPGPGNTTRTVTPNRPWY